MTIKDAIELGEYAESHGMKVCEDHGPNAVVVHDDGLDCPVCEAIG